MSYRPSGRRAAEIAADVEAAVAAGRAPAGTVLPTVRSLAAELGLSPGTVAGAYRLLADRGVVEGHSRAGTVVRARPAPVLAGGPVVPPGTRDLATGNPDPGLLPDVGPALASVAAHHVPGVAMRLYGDPSVLPELGAWARASFASDGIAGGAVTVCGGALDGVERALTGSLRPGMRVAVEDPGYPGVLDLVGALGLVPEPVTLDDAGMIPSVLAGAIDRGAQAVVLTPRAQNPTGAALTPARCDELADLLAAAPEVLVVEDDHAGPVAGSPPLTVLRGTTRPGVVVRSCSKAFGPDLRVAFIGGDAATIAAIEARQSVGTGWVSHLLQHVVLRMVTDPAADATLASATARYAERRAALLRELAGRGVAARGESGLNVWVGVAEEAAVVAGMAARGWAIAPGARFRLASPPAVRVTISTLDPADAPAVAADLQACVTGPGARRMG